MINQNSGKQLFVLCFVAATTLILFLSACGKFSSYPIASMEKPYVGLRIVVLAPQATGYYFVDKSHDDTDHFMFAKHSDTGANVIAFAQCYRIGSFYAKLDADQTLEFVTKIAIKEHFRTLFELDYKVIDVMIGTAICKRIDIYGELLSMSFSTVKGYDILCIHPEWAQALHPFVVRIGANLSSAKNSTKGLPAELKSFFQNVTFRPKNENR